VNFEIPNVPEDYVHRIGRTGRAGATGEAISLVCVDEKKMFNDIERLIKRDVEIVMIPGFEPDPTIKAQPIQLRSAGHVPQRGGGGGGRGGGGRGGAGGGSGRSGQGRAKPAGGGRAPAPRGGGAPRPAGTGTGARTKPRSR